MDETGVSFAARKDIIRSLCRLKGIRKRFWYSKPMIDAVYQLVLAVREESIDAVVQHRKNGAVTTITRFRYAGRDYEMSVCERRPRRAGRFSWINIQTLPHMTDHDVTYKSPLDGGVTYEEILRVLKELSQKNAGKISAHSRRDQERKQHNRQKAVSRKRAAHSAYPGTGTRGAEL